MFTTSYKAGSKSLFSSVSINIKTGCSLFAVYCFSQHEKKQVQQHVHTTGAKYTRVVLRTCVLLQFYKAKKLKRKVFKFTVLRPDMFHLRQYKTDTTWNIDKLGGGGVHFAYNRVIL